jgi:MarR family transcriptional regulator, organic hydroperoxide resistance regulator
MEKEKLAENLLSFGPFIGRFLFKDFPNIKLSRQQYELLFKVFLHDQQKMSYYSEKMMISNSNLTVLADKLISEGFIERIYDPADRRSVSLKITKKGDKYLHDQRNMVKDNLIKKFDSLDESDIKRLNEMMEEMKLIFEKINS